MGQKRAGYAFTAPFVIVFLIFSVYPILFTLQLSFTSWRGVGSPDWVGISNYIFLLGNEHFWYSIWNSSALWVLILPAQMFLSLVIAVLVNNAKVRARSAYRIIFLVPFVTPLVAVAQIWKLVFDTDYGLVNYMLTAVGLDPVPWLTSVQWAKPTLAFLFIWKTTGFIVMILLSGLQSIDEQVYEAATIDGAGAVRQFTSITFPLIQNTLLFAVILQTIAVFQMFAEPFVITQGGPYSSTTTAGLYLYNHINRADLGTGAANSFLLIVAVAVFSIAASLLSRKVRQ